MVRVAFIFNNYNTFGHAKSIFSLVKSLNSAYGPKTEVHIIEVGIRKTGIFPLKEFSRYHYFALPQKLASYSPCRIAKFHKHKLAFFKSNLKRIYPHVLVTEFYPFCRDSSWLGFDTLIKFAKENLKSKVVCSSFYPDWSSRCGKVFKDYYDLLILHIPLDLRSAYSVHLNKYQLRGLREFVKAEDKKIRYSGFLADFLPKTMSGSPVERRLLFGRRKLVVVSRGGQKVYKKMILTSLKVASRRKDLFFLIQQDENFYELAGLAAKRDNVRLMSASYPEAEGYMQEAAVNINMAGYNTMSRLLSHGQKAVVFPLNHSEQLWNASLLSRYSGSEVMDIKKVTAASLESGIDKMLAGKAQKTPRLSKGCFLGARSSADMIFKLGESH